MFVEGVDERSDGLMRASHSELRTQGPYVKEISKKVWRVTCEINIYLTHFMEMSGDAYAVEKWGGIFMEAMDAPINIYKYGDDNSFIGCLRVELGKGNEISFFDFGIANNDTRVHQAEIDASFKMTTTLGD